MQYPEITVDIKTPVPPCMINYILFTLYLNYYSFKANIMEQANILYIKELREFLDLKRRQLGETYNGLASKIGTDTKTLRVFILEGEGGGKILNRCATYFLNGDKYKKGLPETEFIGNMLWMTEHVSVLGLSLSEIDTASRRFAVTPRELLLQFKPQKEDFENEINKLKAKVNYSLRLDEFKERGYHTGMLKTHYYESGVFEKIFNKLWDSVSLTGDVRTLLLPLYPKLVTSSIDKPYQLHSVGRKEEEVDYAFKFFSRSEASNLLNLTRKLEILPEKIEKKGKKIRSYIITGNFSLLHHNSRKELEKLVKTFEESRFIAQCKIYDCGQFAEYIINETKVHFRKLLLKSNRQMRNLYMRKWGQQFYIEEVPFGMEGETHYNPTSFLKEVFKSKWKDKEQQTISASSKTMSKERNARSYSEKWFFILGEFGLGKTSLLLHLCYQNYKKTIPVFVPVAQLGASAFDSLPLLARHILKIILNRQVDRESLYYYLLEQVFLDMMQNKSDLLLLFDGLDEYHYAYQLNYQRRIFNTISTAECSCFFSVREEFWYDHYGMICTSLLGRREFKGMLKLQSWSDKEVLSYAETLSHDKEASKIFDQLKSLSAEGKDGQYFGDLPKRPLFLNMLTQDIQSGCFETKTKAECYETYLGNKFQIDRSGAFDKNEMARLLESTFYKDLTTISGEIFRILEYVAFAMAYKNEEGKLVFQNHIAEEKILRLIKEFNLEDYKISELLMNSVLVPVARRNARKFNFRFAHKSFHEYFLACYLFELLDQPKEDQHICDLFYCEGTENTVCLLNSIIKKEINDEVRASIERLRSKSTHQKSIISRII